MGVWRVSHRWDLLTSLAGSVMERAAVESGQTFDAVSVSWLKGHRLFRIVKLQDAYIFAYIGMPEELRKPNAAYVMHGLLGYFLYRRGKRKQERLDREAADMRALIATATPQELLQLHRYNFRVEKADIADSRIVPSIFHLGNGPWWRFRQKSNGVHSFRLLPSVVEQVRKIVLQSGAAAN
jgi:hypothetical protein